MQLYFYVCVMSGFLVIVSLAIRMHYICSKRIDIFLLKATNKITMSSFLNLKICLREKCIFQSVRWLCVSLNHCINVSITRATLQNLEDLVSTLVTSLERLWTRDICTQADFENVVKSLRHQLVAMAMGTRCPLTSPRIEVKVSHDRTCEKQ